MYNPVQIQFQIAVQQIDGAKALQSYENQTVELTTTITNTISGDKTSTKLARIPGSSMIEYQVTPDSNTERVMITVSFWYDYHLFWLRKIIKYN